MNYIGIDIAAESFAASIFTSVIKPIISKPDFVNNPDGFESFVSWMNSYGVDVSNSILCMEATGVYGESLCYWLAAKDYRIVVEHPMKVKKAFLTKGHKTDEVDSKKIAEYAYRHVDKLKLWSPPGKIVEQIKVLLTSRVQFVKQKTANKNALKALKRKEIQTPLANKMHKENIDRLKKQIDRIEKEIQKINKKIEDKEKIANNISKKLENKTLLKRLRQI